jgi:crotonobetainyl-CoA:carnitine CoA-transferase CaiB-like acyl-CoA transferase
LTREDAAGRLGEAGTAYGFVNGLAELADHPALRRTEIGIPGGQASIVAPPALYDNLPPRLGPVPAIGEQTSAIRLEFAGPAAVAAE